MSTTAQMTVAVPEGVDAVKLRKLLLPAGVQITGGPTAFQIMGSKAAIHAVNTAIKESRTAVKDSDKSFLAELTSRVERIDSGGAQGGATQGGSDEGASNTGGLDDLQPMS